MVPFSDVMFPPQGTEEGGRREGGGEKERQSIYTSVGQEYNGTDSYNSAAICGKKKKKKRDFFPSSSSSASLLGVSLSPSLLHSSSSARALV